MQLEKLKSTKTAAVIQRLTRKFCLACRNGSLLNF